MKRRFLNTLLFEDIAGRKRAEEKLRRMAQLDAFSIKLADALSPIGNAEEIKLTASHILGEHLQVDRAYYSEMAPDNEYAINPKKYYGSENSVSIAGRYRVKDYSQWG